MELKVTEQVMDEKLGRMVNRVVLPRVVMHSRYHYAAYSGNFTGLELEDGGGRGTSGLSFIMFFTCLFFFFLSCQTMAAIVPKQHSIRLIRVL